MKNSKLQMPANYAALNENDRSCVEGGGIISQAFYAFGRMFTTGCSFGNWSGGAKELEQAHGAIVSRNNGVYTYSDGYTYTESGDWGWGTNRASRFFYDIGQWFESFGL